MRLKIYSDLHIEFGNFTAWKKHLTREDAESTLVLAGDIGTGCKAMSLVEDMSEHFKHVVFILGNHESYGHDIAEVKDAWLNMSDETLNVYCLQDESIELDGVVFYGGTMWTSVNNGEFMDRHMLLTHMNDFNRIRKDDRQFTVDDWIAEHESFMGGLKECVTTSDGKKLVVVSHHAPCSRSIHPMYQGDPLNSGFFEPVLDRMCYKGVEPTLWIHGHVHHSVDYNLGGCRVVCNPRGYVGYELNQQFLDGGLIVEV